MKFLTFVMVICLLSACTTAELIKTTAMQIKNTHTTRTGHYKVGNPYRIENKWYFPKEDPNYEEVGIASWYGDAFHLRPTGNGEIFDKNKLSAAHRTLPMPSMVRVTNLENGRSMLLRVNDRGPFAKNRIIDLSEAAAKELGVYEKGTAEVRVTFDKDASAELLDAMGQHYNFERKGPVPLTPISPIAREGHYVQTGAFGVYDNAIHVAKKLQHVGDVRIENVTFPDRVIYRVRLGPFERVEDADYTIKEVTALGFKDAIIVAD